MKGALRLLAALLALRSASPAFSQTSTAGTLEGRVLDAQGSSVPDAMVNLAGPAVAGHREVRVGADGFFRFVELPPGDYVIRAERDGFKPAATTIAIRAGLTRRIDLPLAVSNVNVTVHVTTSEPLLDMATAVHAVNIRGDLQSALPLSPRRDWADFLLVIPGVVHNDAGLYWVHGAQFLSHVMQIDGIDIAPARGGTNDLIRFNTDTFEDVQVKTAGIDAAAPLGAGLVISIASRSGSDSLSGIQSISVRPSSWNANNNPGGTSAGSRFTQVDSSLGGPVRRGRAWLFGSYRYFREIQSISRTPEQIRMLQALASEPFRPFPNETAAHVSFVKLTTRLSPTHQVYGLHQYDRTPSSTTRPTSATRLSQSLFGGRVAAIGLTSVWASVLTRATISYNSKGFGSEALGTGPLQVIHREAFLSSGVPRGSGPIVFRGNAEATAHDTSNKWTVAGEATHYRSGPGGTHNFRLGVTVQHRRERLVTEYSNAGYFQEQLRLRDPTDPAAGVVAFQRLTYEPARLPIISGRGLDVSVHAQDDWAIGRRLTLGLGLRADVIRRSDRIFGVSTQRSTEIGPRLGVNYALTADHRNILRASWGRVHDSLLTNSIPVGDETAASTTAYDVNLDGVFDRTLTTPRITALKDRLRLDLRRGQPYVNEWALGYGRQFPSHVTVDGSFIRREYRNRTAFVATNGIFDAGIFGGYRNPEVDEIYEVTGNRWNWKVYSGLEARVTRQTGRLQLLAGYTRGFQHMGGTWQPNDPASFIQPDAFPNDAGIGDVVESTSAPANYFGSDNSLSGSSDTFAPQWRKHTLRVAANTELPGRVLLATTYVFQSGVWSGPVVTRVDVPDPRFGPAIFELSNGRRVTNPLATTLRFAYPTRGDGQFMLPGLHFWNVRIGRVFEVPNLRSRLEVLMDVFNLPNLGADQRFEFGANQRFSPTFRTGANRQLPRSVALSARVSF